MGAEQAADTWIAEVGESYCQLRGNSQLLSPGDYTTICRWWDAYGQHGIDAGIILEEIGEVLEKKRKAAGPWWRPKGISYFKPAIRERCQQILEWQAIGSRS